MSEEEKIQSEIAVQGTSFELERAPENAVDKIFQLILKNGYENLRPDIKVTKLEMLNKIEYIQRRKYDISLEIQEYWPKISAIFLDSLDKKEVTFRFKNHPNFTSIKKLCHLYSIKPIVSEHNTTVSNDIVITNTDMTLQSEDMPYFLAHLYNVYEEISKEAADLIWEVLKDITEETLNDLVLGWKDKIYRDLNSWKEYTLEKEECKKFFPADDCKAAKKYDNLDDQEKQEFFKGVISYHVEIVSSRLLSFVSAKDHKFIKKAFSSANKTIAYIEAFYPDKLSLTVYVNRKTEEVLVNAFEPGYFTKVLNLLDDNSKSIKVRATTLGAMLSISKKYGYSIPYISQILLGIDFSKIMLGVLFEKGQLSSNDKNTLSEEPEVDLTEIASTFSNIFTLCNYDKVVDLKNESQDILIEFKGTFLYEVIKLKECQNVVDADCALSLLSDFNFVNKIIENNFKNTKTLFFVDNTSISIIDFVTNFNLPVCYKSLQNSLLGLTEEKNEDMVIAVENKIDLCDDCL